MKTKTTIILISILTLGLVAAGLLLQSRMPETVATHWGFNGEADGFSSRAVGIFLLPAILAGSSLLLLAIPQIDPLRKNIQKFRPQYNSFILVYALFLGYLHVLTLIWNTGTEININRYLLPAVGFFYYFTGILVSKARRNYFIGIRTPWKLASEEVWDKTHALGGWLFKIAGGIMLLSVFIPEYTIHVMLGTVLAATLIAVVYSYIIYARLKPYGENGGS